MKARLAVGLGVALACGAVVLGVRSYNARFDERWWLPSMPAGGGPGYYAPAKGAAVCVSCDPGSADVSCAMWFGGRAWCLGEDCTLHLDGQDMGRPEAVWCSEWCSLHVEPSASFYSGRLDFSPDRSVGGSTSAHPVKREPIACLDYYREAARP